MTSTEELMRWTDSIATTSGHAPFLALLAPFVHAVVMIVANENTYLPKRPSHENAESIIATQFHKETREHHCGYFGGPLYSCFCVVLCQTGFQD
jgi:hypothetical protein